MTITRVPLREQVHRAVVDRILREELAPGARISDSVMAQELGVSRTPVREALLRLEREGFLEVDMGRGFFVKPLSGDEVRETYPVLWTLEVLALRSSPCAEAGTVAELDRINAQLAEAGEDPERRIDLDVEWHDVLLGRCANRRLLEMIGGLKAVVRRYEYAYMQNAGHIPVSTRTHADIARALHRGDVEAAVPLLESNWRFSMDEILEWLER
ncbi:MAG: GntR family transcriptional regulator [Gemmatimonadetes bacterium]|nr:GntR family transcriptional regulator [Gemmatimonadota bacterium]